MSDSDLLGCVAVVVTFNRCDLLDRLVTRLLTFSRLDAIVIVDNASRDETPARVHEWQEKDRRIVYKRLTDNLGGAGGFKAGLKEAYDMGAELVWMMDDDGIPTEDCLDTLLEYRADYDFWGPAVLAEGDDSQLCFPIRLPGTATTVRTREHLQQIAVDGKVADVLIPFNGVMVTRELIERIGYVRSEFFIWGDDVEYLWRARDAQARIATIVDAHFHHPATDDLGTEMLFGITTYNHSPSDLKHYCMARNNTVNLLTFGGLAHAAAFWAKTVWFYTIVRPSWSRLSLSLRAVIAGIRRDFSGHRRFLKQTLPARAEENIPPREKSDPMDETVAAVIVTYERPELLDELLEALRAQTRPVDAIFVIDNGTDQQTLDVLESYADLPLVVDIVGENLGGAGGFNRGVKAAYEAGFDWIWLMDDDVRPAPWALKALLTHREDMMACVRENRRGELVEKAAMRFDLSNPFQIKPKVSTVDQQWRHRLQMPEKVRIDNAAFEGFMTHRRVVETIGLPDPSYFIFYDDCDFQLRGRRAGFQLWAIRDALMRRAFDFVQKDALASWKGYYMYRNLFAVHFRYGENILVKIKPFILAAGIVAFSPVRGGMREARNAIRGLRDAWPMRHIASEAFLDQEN